MVQHPNQMVVQHPIKKAADLLFFKIVKSEQKTTQTYICKHYSLTKAKIPIHQDCIKAAGWSLNISLTHSSSSEGCFIFTPDMHPVFCSNFLLISKYNFRARNSKHIPSALRNLSRENCPYIFPCWDALHAKVSLQTSWCTSDLHVLTFQIYLSAFTIA